VKLIVGLGNPGEKYTHTRHNIGFDIIDYCANQWQVEMNEVKFKGIYGMKLIDGEKVFLLKPMTYMNLSGESVRPLMEYFKIDLKDVLVIYDDLDLPVGKIRLREKGGHGGHNGMKSISAHLGLNEFKRIRVGIDRPTQGESISNYVLGKFSKEERLEMEDVIKTVASASEYWLGHEFLEVMNKFN
jgi:PTH1 family peptidyl-tRNA hydrolase